MSKLTICDLCGGPVGLDGEGWKRFKVKERGLCLDGFRWITIDAHDRCVEKLLKESKWENEMR
jgi:hypothetical protein